MENPSIIALAGPNGAGKSTAGPALIRDTLGVTTFVDADVIARGLSAFAPEAAARPAGRIMLRRMRELTRQRESFAFETTLAGRSYATWIEDLLCRHYEFHVVFLWLPSADFAVARVADRVRLGGRVAQLGKAFGMNVLAWGREATSERARAEGFEMAKNREAFFEASDVVSIHLPLNKATRGLVTGKDLSRMKPDPALVPYSVNVPLWSDGAAKDRSVMLPGTETVRVRDDVRVLREATEQKAMVLPKRPVFLQETMLGDGNGEGARSPCRG